MRVMDAAVLDDWWEKPKLSDESNGSAWQDVRDASAMRVETDIILAVPDGGDKLIDEPDILGGAKRASLGA